MGIEIRLTDQHFPVSPAFLEFLYRFLTKNEKENRWHRQLNEKLHNDAAQILALATEKSNEVVQNPIAQKTISRSYDLMMSLMFGATDRLADYQNRIKYILVVGCPRSGGSYLTKHLFQAIGKKAEDVPGVIGHDGFPDPVPFCIQERNNAYTTLTRHTAEYMAMAELFFSQDTKHNGKLIAPKKATKAAYYGAFYNEALGKETELIISIRHPTASCISSYEKSGGLPKEQYFKVRSNIESWIERDIEFLTGKKPLNNDNYFDCYLHYWENYHYSLVLSGLLANPNKKFVAFDGEQIMATAREFYERFDTVQDVDEFRISAKEPPEPEWRKKGDQAVKRVASLWDSFGHHFPTEEIMKNL